ncbi:hypothetical protein [Cupriavidus sp. DL-D2]|uniref:hypothetical protein n=1 Tax=Cupriavidus sp. DL-D2 TaxID=3144974 RepID=UPI003215C25B
MDKPTQTGPDWTPDEVLDGMLMAHKACKRDTNLPCGALIKMGFFFDGFGRHRDIDDPKTSRYSNICRLWEAHRDNVDRRRESMPNQYWYRFYFSGLGTPLNEDAKTNELLTAARNAGISAARSSARAVFEKLPGVSIVYGTKKAASDTTKDALVKAYDELSWRPIAKSFDDMVRHARDARTQAGRVLRMTGVDGSVARGKAAVRRAMSNAGKNPLKTGAVAAKTIVVDMGLDSIPFMRDSKAAAMVFGTGVEVRLRSALMQFEAAILDAKSKAKSVLSIEVSVFGADRGGVIARTFVNELVRKYKRDNDLDLRFSVDRDDIAGAPIEIRMLGLLDAVSSIMAENALLSYVPYLGAINQNHKDRDLAVPAVVQRCVHFAAAHELRFYQRLDSLEKTRGRQYLYPGTSEDITGGAAPGSLGFRGELQRIALRDMLHEALMAGSIVDTIEDQEQFKPRTFEKFSLAAPVSNGKTSYQIGELVDAYWELVPRDEGLNFHAHMKVFLRWLAVRYRTPEFRAPAYERLPELKHKADEAQKAVENANNDYFKVDIRKPGGQEALNQAGARLENARKTNDQAGRDYRRAKEHPIISVWDRVAEEAARQLLHRGIHANSKQWPQMLRDIASTLPEGIEDVEMVADVYEQSDWMSADAFALAEAWITGTEGRDPLPEKVMMLFDMLVHDTMLTSWHDHVLSSTLYFRTRETDTFGETDEKEEKKQREADDRRVKDDAARRARAEAIGLPGSWTFEGRR